MLDGASEALQARMMMNAQQMRLGLAGMAIGIAGLGASFALAHKAGEFEGRMTNLKVIFGASTEQMDKFREAVLNADHSMFSPVEQTAALQEFAQRGFSATQAMAMLKPSLDLATASMGQLGVEQAAALAGEAIHAFSLKAEDSTRMVDQMAKAANMSGLAFKELPLGVGQAGRGAAAANQSFEETLLVLGMVRNATNTVERASNATAVAMERMVSGVKSARELQATVSIFDKGTGQVRRFRDIIADLMPMLDKMGIKKEKAFLQRSFGQRGLLAAEAVVNQLKAGVVTPEGKRVTGKAMIAYQDEQMRNAGGTASKIAEEQLKTFPGQMDLLKASFGRLFVVLGEGFASALKPLITGLDKFITFFKNAFEGLPEPVKKGIAIFIMLGSAITALLGTFIVAKALMVMFGATLPVIGGALAALAVPIAIAAGALAAFILLFAALREHSNQTHKGVIEFFIDLGRKIKLAFQGLMQLFQEGAFSGAVMKELNTAENSGVKAFAIKVYLWVNRIQNFLEKLAVGFKERIKELQPVFDNLVYALKFVASALGITVGSAKENQTAFDEFGQTGKEVGRVLGDLAGVFAQAVIYGLLATYTVINLLKDAFTLLGPTVSAQAMIVWGSLKLIMGILSGDWNTTWSGAIDVVYGGMHKLISATALLLRGLILLSKVAWFGKDPGGALAAADKWVEKTELANHDQVNVARDEARNMAGLNRAATFDTPVPSSTNSPGIAAGKFQMEGTRSLIEQWNTPQAQAPAGPQTIQINNIMRLDGEDMMHWITRVEKDLKTRGFTMATP